jgi:hypothetical protein
MLTVKEVLEQLSKMDPKRVVIMARDAEGNGFKPLHKIATGAYNKHDDEIGLETLTPELQGRGFTQADVMKGGKPALILWPED